MSETEFFLRLEIQICGELICIREKSLCGYWCDGFMPDGKFDIVDVKPQITREIWIADGSMGQSRWHFFLLPGYEISDLSSIQWKWLLPNENVTRWLAMDWSTKVLRIDLLSAYPDESFSTK